jgi:hypothetical protein
MNVFLGRAPFVVEPMDMNPKPSFGVDERAL